MQAVSGNISTGVNQKRKFNAFPLVTRSRKLLAWYGFLMVFPVILIFQNISFYVFPFLLKAYSDIGERIFRIRHFVQVIAIFFGIAAILSVFTIPAEAPPGSFSRALQVLPNYLYWVILLIFIVNIRRQILANVALLYKVIFWGIIAACAYYFFFQSILTSLFVFKRLSQNAYGFLLICFSPIAVYYGLRRKGKVAGYGLFILFTMLGFLSGSRSASLLVFAGCLGALFVSKMKLQNIFYLAAVAAAIFYIVFEVQAIRPLVFNLNKRTYNLLYNREEILRTDRSYLVRLAMIEKAMELHKKYPYTGIGLNNFADYTVKLPGEFEGAEFIVNKKGVNEASAHNSYMGLLSEGGLFLLIPFLLLQLYCLFVFLILMNRIPPYLKPFFIGFIFMSVHLYFIMAIVNVFAWFLIAIVCAFSTMALRNELSWKK